MDDLQRNGYQIIQNPSKFCFGMDAVLLSGFAKVKPGERALDLGTGTGIIPILLRGKTSGRDFTGLEIQEESADMARRSVELNALSDSVSIVQGDIKEAFLLVLFAAITSSIALTESAVSTFEDELGWGRKKATVLVGVIMLVLGSLSSLGYGPLAGIKIIGMQFLDLFDFLTNSVMMPIAALLTSLLVSRVVGIDKIEDEIIHGESAFRRKKVFVVMIKYLCPVFAIIILLSSVANALGWIKM